MFVKPGLQTLVQDGGRFGFSAFGVPTSGPMDRTSAQIANWLVGNPSNAACLEITMTGPKILVTGECQIALAGADLSATLDGQSIPMYQTIHVKTGSQVGFGRLVKGCRVYLAVRGNFLIPSVLKSKSAMPFAGENTTPESVAKKASHISIQVSDPIEPRRLTLTDSEPLGRVTTRYLKGPEWQQLSSPSQAFFSNETFYLSRQCNRMGYRMLPEIPGYEKSEELISSGIIPGTVQLTNAGQPVILMADAQTTGGYPRIANIIRADLDALGQLKPGDKINFAHTSIKAARDAWIDHHRWVQDHLKT